MAMTKEEIKELLSKSEEQIKEVVEAHFIGTHEDVFNVRETEVRICNDGPYYCEEEYVARAIDFYDFNLDPFWWKRVAADELHVRAKAKIKYIRGFDIGSDDEYIWEDPEVDGKPYEVEFACMMEPFYGYVLKYEFREVE